MLPPASEKTDIEAKYRALVEIGEPTGMSKTTQYRANEHNGFLRRYESGCPTVELTCSISAAAMDG